MSTPSTMTRQCWQRPKWATLQGFGQDDCRFQLVLFFFVFWMLCSYCEHGHRTARISHTQNIFSRVAQGPSAHRVGGISQNSHPHGHRSCFLRSHPCTHSALSLLLLAHGVSILIRTLVDSLADLLNNVLPSQLLIRSSIGQLCSLFRLCPLQSDITSPRSD